MATNTAGNSARQLPIQAAHTARFTVNYNDAGISSGVAKVTIPLGAFITNVQCEIVTAFNAATTNVLTVGTNATSYNDIIAAGDVDEAVAANNDVTRGRGRSIAATAAKTVYAKYTQTGTAATAGVAVVVITFEANLG